MFAAFKRQVVRPAAGLAVALMLVGSGCAAAANGAHAAPATTPMAHDAAMPMNQGAATPMATEPAALSVTPVATTSVTIQNFAFSPAAIVVPVGAKVTWTNQDIEQHTVTARDHAYNSDALNQSQTFTMTFSKAGTYQYFCEIHPHMTGTIIVK